MPTPTISAKADLHVLCANTVMKSLQDKQELARFTLHAALQARGVKI